MVAQQGALPAAAKAGVCLLLLPTLMSIGLSLYFIITGGSYYNTPCSQPYVQGLLALGCMTLVIGFSSICQLMAAARSGNLKAAGQSLVSTLLGMACFGLLIWMTVILFQNSQWNAYLSLTPEQFAPFCDPQLYVRASAGIITMWCLGGFGTIFVCCMSCCVVGAMAMSGGGAAQTRGGAAGLSERVRSWRGPSGQASAGAPATASEPVSSAQIQAVLARVDGNGGAAAPSVAGGADPKV